ncbi:MAG: YdcF family protein [Alphaproteobacteria bacterium]|nr:YdcF family protein [Alphaproteobacteria bacterium]
MLIIPAIAVAIYLVGFLVFLAMVPSHPTEPLKADAIVALTGGNTRLDAAVALLEGGTGKRLLITGVNRASTKAQIKVLYDGGRKFDCCTDMGYAAEDTYGNAEEAAAWMALHHFHSLILVTANYHMPRSLRLFHAAMPTVRLVAYPVEPQGVDIRAWWHPGTLHLLHNEYLKYLTSLMILPVDHKLPEGKAHAAS